MDMEELKSFFLDNVVSLCYGILCAIENCKEIHNIDEDSEMLDSDVHLDVNLCMMEGCQVTNRKPRETLTGRHLKW